VLRSHSLSFLPSFSSAGLRGCSANIVLLEEASFIAKDTFFRVIAPLMTMDDLTLLAISTVETEHNYYSELLNLENEKGDPLFKDIKIILSCDACRRAGRQTRCVHNLHQLPPWRGSRRQQLVEKIMSSDPELFMRENLGIVASTNVFLFEKEWIRWCFAAAPCRFERHPDVVYVAIDPSGGGSQSDYAICSAAFERGTCIVSVLPHVHICCSASNTNARCEGYFLSSGFLHSLPSLSRPCMRMLKWRLMLRLSSGATGTFFWYSCDVRNATSTT
jgi:hypothetical protein